MSDYDKIRIANNIVNADNVRSLELAMWAMDYLDYNDPQLWWKIIGHPDFKYYK